MKVIGIVSANVEVYSHAVDNVVPRSSGETIEGFRARVEQALGRFPAGHSIAHVLCVQGDAVVAEWGEPEYIHAD